MFSSEVLFDEKDKKEFQLNANCPLADSMDYTVNKFEHVGGLYSKIKVEHVLGAGPPRGD